MKRKYLIIIIIILLLFISSTGFAKSPNEKNIISISGTNFTIPNNYYECDLNENGDINITNGSNSLFISHYNDPNVKSHINEYFNYCQSFNQTVSFSNFTIDDILVYKTIINQKQSTCYWFEKNNQTYIIHNQGDVSIPEDIFFDLIKSTKN